jgi:flagellar basal-body rod protein FlgB
MIDITAVTSETTSQLVRLALNAASAKHMAIAQNIANVNTDGYQPMRVDFERQVGLFRDQLLDRRQDGESARVLEDLRSSALIEQAPEPGAEQVELDSEVAKMVQNSLHYQALLAAHGKLASILRMAVTGGR